MTWEAGADMNFRILTVLLAAAFAAAACDSTTTAGDEVATAAGAPVDPLAAEAGEPGSAPAASAKVGGPVTVSYRLIGTPIVGQPLAIELLVSSSLGDQPVRVDYRILDASALRLADSQSPFATVAAGADDATGREQVTVVPLREGRLYLNVAATVEAGGGTLSTVTAIPIQVGTGTRELRENGSLETDASGEAVRVLGGTED